MPFTLKQESLEISFFLPHVIVDLDEVSAQEMCKCMHLFYLCSAYRESVLKV